MIAGLEGVGPLALQPEGELAGPYATNAEDCVNLIALAAVQAGGDDPEMMAKEIPEVSRSGVPCAVYADCMQLLTANRSIDYDGAGGTLQIGMEGDPQVARFQVFTFDPAGVDRDDRTMTITP